MVTDLSQLRHHSVRDLAWAISSPPLISQLPHRCVWPQSGWYRYIAEETLPWLSAIDQDPAELDELLALQKDRRLGRYFETLWYYWLSHHKRYQIIEQNLQIIIDGETLGEIDFILFDSAAKQTVHWELAVKFYLGVGNTREMSNWYGPGLHDRLDKKVQHLLQRQSLITEDQRVAHWLKQKGIAIDGCAVILKGRLYYPWVGPSSTTEYGDPISISPPPQCALDHLNSVWLRLSQFDLEFDNQQKFLPLLNSGWLEKIPTLSGIESYHKNELLEIVSNNKIRLPLQVQLCKPHNGWDRVFLVDESWPYEIA